MKAVDPTLLAVTLMQQCLNGFENEHHHRKWRAKWAKEISGLPLPLRGGVEFAWEQATQSVEDADYSHDEECDARSGLPGVGDK